MTTPLGVTITLESDCGHIVSFVPSSYPCRVHIHRWMYLVSADGVISFECMAHVAAARLTTRRFGAIRDVNVSIPCRSLDSVHWHGYFMRINKDQHAEFVSE